MNGEPPLCAQHQQALEVLAFRKFERHRMVRGGAVALDDLRLDTCIEGGAGDNRLAERGVRDVVTLYTMTLREFSFEE